MVAPTIKNGAAVVAGGRRVNRRRPSKNNSLAAKKAREADRRQKAANSLKVDPTQFADFKDKLAAGDLDQKLMGLMKEHNDMQAKNNNDEAPTPLSLEELDRQIKQQKQKFNNDANVVEGAYKKLTGRELKKEQQPTTNNTAATEAINVTSVPSTQSISGKQSAAPVLQPITKALDRNIAESLAAGSEHQGLRYDPTHYGEEDEEEAMMKALLDRDHIRFNMGI